MKIAYHLIFLMCSPALYHAQANFFDVPSADTIAQGSLYFQQQASLNTQDLQFSTIATFGLGRGFEAGLNIHQLTYDRQKRRWPNDGDDPGSQPDILFNAQKIFGRSGWHRLGLGGKIGFNYSDEMKASTRTEFYYLNNRLTVPNTLFGLSTGIYYGNKNYIGNGNNWGIMAGMQIPLLGKFLMAQADFTSGVNALSFFNAGLTLSVFGWKLSTGAGIPLPESGNDFHWLIQLTHD